MIDSLEKVIKKDYPHIFATTIYKSDELVFETYKRGHKNKVRTTRSLTKSIISTLYGIAIQQGYLKNLDEKVISFFPEYKSTKLDDNIGAITIRHLLTMTSGLDCSDRRPKGFFKSKNWTRFYIERPILHNPGTKFNYSSAGSHLLSALLYKLTSLNVYDFAKVNLFGPLGIEESKWSHDQQGFYHGGFGLDLSAKSITKLGQLYLNNGEVSGIRLLPESYIQEATTSQAPGGFPENDHYGFHWWVGPKESTHYYYAAGLGGQYLFVVPEYDLLVTITSDSRRPHIENKKIFTDIVLPSYQS